MVNCAIECQKLASTWHILLCTICLEGLVINVPSFVNAVPIDDETFLSQVCATPFSWCYANVYYYSEYDRSIAN